MISSGKLISRTQISSVIYPGREEDPLRSPETRLSSLTLFLCCIKMGRKRCLKPSGNGKSTRVKGGTDPPDVSLVHVLNDSLSYLKNLKRLCEAKQEAENKYHIENEDDGCWPADDIKRVWGKTQRMKKYSIKRIQWTLVLTLQLIEIPRNDLSCLIEGENISQRCAEQQKNDQMLEQLKAQRENKRREDGLRSPVDMNQACGTTESMKANSEGRFSQSNADLGSVGGMQRSIYIRIPLSAMLHREQTFKVDRVPPVRSPYKLIDGSPEADAVIERRKSYVMSFNKRTNNAKWVYEILNRETLALNCKQQAIFGIEGFGHGYDRGHLASARNHRWCEEDFCDANLNSNITPQHWSLNRGAWSVFETWTRQLSALIRTRNVHVYSGPLYPRDIQMNPLVLQGKTVPSHFFKVIIVENVDGTVEEPECYLLPNEKPKYGTLTEYQRRIEEIEQISGLKLIERQPNVNEDRRITATLQGQDLNKTTRHANIEVRISRK